MIAGVYLLKKSGVVIYVGQSRNVKKRLNEHRRNNIDFDDHEIIETPVADLKKIEQEHILRHRPELNGSTNKFGQQVFFDSSGIAQTSAERQRQHRIRMRELGLSPKEVWLHPDEYPFVKHYADWLLHQTMGARGPGFIELPQDLMADLEADDEYAQYLAYVRLQSNQTGKS